MKRFTLVLFATIVLAIPSAAQSNTSGLYLRPHISAVSLEIGNFDGEDADASGVGLGVALGYGFTSMYSAYLDLAGAALTPDEGDVDLTHLQAEAGVQAMLGSGKIKGYGRLGLNGQSLDIKDRSATLSLSGIGFTFGAGVHYSLSERLGLNVGARYSRVGSIEEYEVEGITINIKDLHGETSTMTTLRLNLGVTVFL